MSKDKQRPSDTHRIAADPVRGPAVWAVFNTRTGEEVERCATRGEAVLAQAKWDALALLRD